MSSTRTATVKIADLVRDDRLRFRGWSHDHGSVVDEYREAMVDYGGWGEFEPIVVCELTAIKKDKKAVDSRYKAELHDVVYVPGTLLLIGGYTRCEAADAASVLEAPAVIHSGDWNYALQLAWSQNSRHGRRRSKFDLELILGSIHQQPQYAAAGEREVALLAGCSRATVNRFRAELKKVKEQANTQPEPPAAQRDSKGSFAASLRDKWQRPVPQHLRPAFEVNADLDARTKSIRKNVIDLGRLKFGPDGESKCLSPGLSELNVEDVTRHLLAAAELIDCQRPFVVCPYCDAVGCSHCKERGWLTRPESERLPPAMEKKAQAYFSIERATTRRAQSMTGGAA
jgi:hypothetical protein